MLNEPNWTPNVNNKGWEPLNNEFYNGFWDMELISICVEFAFDLTKKCKKPMITWSASILNSKERETRVEIQELIKQSQLVHKLVK